MKRGQLACLLSVFAISAAIPTSAGAHGLAAAFVSIDTDDDRRADVLIKLPEIEGQTPSIELRFPDGCKQQAPITEAKRKGGIVRRWSVLCNAALTGMEVHIVGLNAVVGDAFVEFRSPSVESWNTVVRRGTSSAKLGTGNARGLENNSGYLPLGVEDILFGFDHLFFVLALLLIVWRTRYPKGARAFAKTMLATIIAFAVAHSITLAAATLDVIKLPPAPTELVIALSVFLVAIELARDDHSTLTMRQPWLVAFVFGLLHGFGFAGALAEIGLPPSDVMVPLLLFNLGLEVGQIAVVALAACVLWVAHRIRQRLRHDGAGYPLYERTLIYGIGIVTAYWCFERSLGWLV